MTAASLQTDNDSFKKFLSDEFMFFPQWSFVMSRAKYNTSIAQSQPDNGGFQKDCKIAQHEAVLHDFK